MSSLSHLPLRLISGLVAFAALNAPQMVAAQELGYFTGTYELIGRDGAKEPRLLNQMLRLEPEGEALRVLSCEQVPGRLERGLSELPNSFGGEILGQSVFCSAYNNADNYAHFACHGEDGARFSLWPTMEPSETQLSCG